MQQTISRWRILSFMVFVAILAGCGGRSLTPSPEARSRQESFSPPQGKVIHTARTLLGIPYRFGGMSPAGFDCSGYVAYVFKESVGKRLPRRTKEQIRFGKAVPPAKVEPGDLLYFWIKEQGISHVGIYIGQDQFIHAPSRNGRVNIQRLRDSYWKARYRGARRFL
jgi:cell wall-associated NlpC family hydrolase